MSATTCPRVDSRISILLTVFGLCQSGPCYSQTVFYSLPYEVQTLYLVCQSGGVYLQYCDVNGTVSPIPNTGGHMHEGVPRYGNPRQGSLYPASGNTGAQGFVTTQYGATRIAQTETIRACAAGGGCSDVSMIVRRPNLQQLWAGWAHVMIGATPIYPYNHFYQTGAHADAIKVVEQYAIEYKDLTVPTVPELWEPVGVNDSSLPTGGVFDICATNSGCLPNPQNPAGGANPWSGPHQSGSHDIGEAFDVRANNGVNNIIPSLTVKDRFRQICRERGFPIALHESIGSSNEHIHCARF